MCKKENIGFIDDFIDAGINQQYIGLLLLSQSKTMSRPRRSHTIPDKIILAPNPDIVYTEEEMTVESGQCRICLEGYIEGNRLIAPCKCTGSVQFIHQECMKQWIQKNREKRVNPVRCQLCKEAITYSIVLERQCHPWQVIKQKLCLNYKIFFFLLFLFLINCGVTIYLIVIFVHIIQVSSGTPKFIEIGVISFSIVLLLVISSILMGIIVREFIYCESRKIGNILNFADRNRKTEMNTSFESKGNVSKAKIHPVTITDIEQLP